MAQDGGARWACDSWREPSGGETGLQFSPMKYNDSCLASPGGDSCDEHVALDGPRMHAWIESSLPTS